jgi:hypothetical protein
MRGINGCRPGTQVKGLKKRPIRPAQTLDIPGTLARSDGAPHQSGSTSVPCIIGTHRPETRTDSTCPAALQLGGDGLHLRGVEAACIVTTARRCLRTVDR